MKKYMYEKLIWGEILPFMKDADFGRESAEQVLEKLCGLLGETVDCVVFATVKGREVFLFTTLPEDEAQYYRNAVEDKLPAERIGGRKSLQMELEIEGVLKGLWVFEVAEHISEEKISAYQNVASVVKLFLYSCLLTQEWERQEQTDSFTGLPGCRIFEHDLYKKLMQREQGFLIVVRGTAEFPRPYREDGMHFFLIRIVDVCRSIHSEGIYRIGPDMVAVLCGERREEVYSSLQEFLQQLPEATFFLAPLSGLDADSIYARIQRGLNNAGEGRIFWDSQGIFPQLPVFREGV